LTRCLIVTAHPLPASLIARLAERAVATARGNGWTVILCDLHQRGFDPRLTADERAAYYAASPSGSTTDEQRELTDAEVLILIFPTWWYGFPAILKGWFDRVWAPGTAFDHAPDLGAMRPRLHGLREVLAITTMGSPAWVDWLVLHRPLRRILCRAIIGPCAPRARVGWRALYRAEAVRHDRLARFEARLTADILAMGKRLT
jgi:NAD(P)H dehydrogenase (quinone)